MEPVIAIGNFGGSISEDSTQELTHIFMESNKENKLYLIQNEAFIRSPKLVYFDFDNCAVRTIGQRAFQKCNNLTNTSFGN